MSESLASSIPLSVDANRRILNSTTISTGFGPLDIGEPPLSTSVSQSMLPGSWDTHIHGTCPKCKHFHNKATVRISRMPGVYNGIRCEKCDHHWFGIGGNSTRISLISQESRRFSADHDHPGNPFQICTNMPDVASLITTATPIFTLNSNYVAVLGGPSRYQPPGSGSQSQPAPPPPRQASSTDNAMTPSVQESNTPAQLQDASRSERFQESCPSQVSSRDTTLPPAALEMSPTRHRSVRGKVKAKVKSRVDRVLKRFGLKVEITRCSPSPSNNFGNKVISSRSDQEIQHIKTPIRNRDTSPADRNPVGNNSNHHTSSLLHNNDHMLRYRHSTHDIPACQADNIIRPAGSVLDENLRSQIEDMRRKATEKAQSQMICACTQDCHCKPSIISNAAIPDNPLVSGASEYDSSSSRGDEVLSNGRGHTARASDTGTSEADASTSREDILPSLRQSEEISRPYNFDIRHIGSHLADIQGRSSILSITSNGSAPSRNIHRQSAMTTMSQAETLCSSSYLESMDSLSEIPSTPSSLHHTSRNHQDVLQRRSLPSQAPLRTDFSNDTLPDSRPPASSNNDQSGISGERTPTQSNPGLLHPNSTNGEYSPTRNDHSSNEHTPTQATLN